MIDGKELYEKLAATKRVMPRSEYGCGCKVCRNRSNKNIKQDFKDAIKRIFEYHNIPVETVMDNLEYKEDIESKGTYYMRGEDGDTPSNACKET